VAGPDIQHAKTPPDIMALVGVISTEASSGTSLATWRVGKPHCQDSYRTTGLELEALYFICFLHCAFPRSRPDGRSACTGVNRGRSQSERAPVTARKSKATAFLTPWYAALSLFYSLAVSLTLCSRLLHPATGRRLTRLLNWVLLPVFPFGTATGIFGLAKVDKGGRGALDPLHRYIC
jgi:hypothetical protein